MLHYHYLNFVSSSQNIKIGNTEFLDNLKKKVNINFIKNLKLFLKKNKVNVRL